MSSGMSSFSEWRENSGKTQSVVAGDLGISQAYLSRILAGASQPSMGLAIKIAAYTDGDVPVGAWPKFEAFMALANGQAAE